MQAPWDYPDFDDHEVVHFVTDPASGLHAVIAVHSTHLGPAGGGVRFWHYPEARRRGPRRPASVARDELQERDGRAFRSAAARR